MMGDVRSDRRGHPHDTMNSGAWSRFASVAIDVSAFLIILLLFVYTLHVIGTPTLPKPLHGEWWDVHNFSDFLTLMGGRHFHEEGFAQNYFTTNDTVGFREFARGWQYYQVPLLVPNSAIFYTHYGSLDAVLAGLLMNLGIARLSDFYRIFSFLSFLSLGLWYVTTSILFGRLIGLVSVVVMGTSVIFLKMALAVSAESLSLDLAILGVFSFVVAHRMPQGGWRRVALAAAWIAGALEANNSPQFMLFIPIVYAGYLLIYAPHNRRSLALFLGTVSGLVLGYLAHLALSAWVLGGVRNLLIDLGAAFSRRTIGFGDAVEIWYKNFRILDSPGYIEGQMWQFFNLGFLSIIGLVFLSGMLARRLCTLGQGRENLMHQWQMILALLAGGAIFIFIFIQATVTQPLDILKVMLPGMGPLIGFTALTVMCYLRTPAQPRWMKLGVFFAVLYILGPYVQMVATGKSFRSDFYPPSDTYSGGSPEEVRAIATFLRENSQYGDIIFANIDTGDTSHIYYPHPAWEYLSDRRIEVFDTIEQASTSLDALARKRESLPASNPARHIHFYVLLNKRFAGESVLGELARHAGYRTAEFDSHRWWLEKFQVDPFPNRTRSYELFQLDPTKWQLHAKQMPVNRSVSAGSGVPWTRVFKMSALPSGEGWNMKMSRDSRLFSGGMLYFSSIESKPGNMSLKGIRFDNSRGSTVEVRMRVVDAAQKSQDEAMLSIQDGRREAKVGFFGTHVDLFDQNDLQATYPFSPGAFHVYRLAVVGDIARLYVDGALAAFERLKHEASDYGILFGDYSPKAYKGLTAEVDYIAYSAMGAFTPGGATLGARPDASIPWTRVFTTDALPVWGALEHVDRPLPVLVSRGRGVLHDAQSNINLVEPRLDNSRGSTVEVRMRVVDAAQKSQDEAMLSIQDGRREAKVGFFGTHVDLFDQNDLQATYPFSPGAFHVYRLAVVSNNAHLYVDGSLVAVGRLTHEVPATEHAIFLGNYSRNGRGRLTAEVDYIGYSTEGAFAPSWTRLDVKR